MFRSSLMSSARARPGPSSHSQDHSLAPAGTVLKFTGIGAAIGAGLGAIAGIGEGFKLAADFEQTSVAMETMLGSAEKAKQVLGDLKQFAASDSIPVSRFGRQRQAALGVWGRCRQPCSNVKNAWRHRRWHRQAGIRAGRAVRQGKSSRPVERRGDPPVHIGWHPAHRLAGQAAWQDQRSSAGHDRSGSDRIPRSSKSFYRLDQRRRPLSPR